METFLEYLPLILHTILFLCHFLISYFQQHSLKKYICSHCGTENVVSPISTPLSQEQIKQFADLLISIEKYSK
ncbi:hypothetical protein [Dipodfec virus UOA04_Rod_763]|nr:hypothetical protein [Dipodfec virus UOA04_Rod_763]